MKGNAMWTSDVPDVPVGGGTLHQLVLESASRHAQQPALIDGLSGRSITYLEMADRIRRTAAALAHRGLGVGHTATVCLPNLPETVCLALGAASAGMTVSTANPAYRAHELEHHISANAPSIVFAPSQHAELLKDIGSHAQMEIVIGTGASVEGCTALNDFLSKSPATELPQVNEDQTAFIFPSSGTTGMPKGVRLSHRNLVTALRETQAYRPVAEQDTSLAVAPIIYIMGFHATLIAPLLQGAKVVLMPKFDTQLVFDVIERHAVTMLFAAPPMLSVLNESAQRRFDSLELISSGGSALSGDVEESLRSRFPNATVAQGWGMTEMSGPVSTAPRGSHTPVGSVGKLIPNTHLRVVDPLTSADLGPHEAGELWVKGPQMMQGYVDNPQATAETVDSDGWLHTGDLGTVDDEGCIRILGRLSELIHVGGGVQVLPSELEKALMSHPSVVDAAVVGRHLDTGSALPVGYVVRRSETTAEELKSWVADRVDERKHLADVIFVEAVPKSPAGKILRRLLA